MLHLLRGTVVLPQSPCVRSIRENGYACTAVYTRVETDKWIIAPGRYIRKRLAWTMDANTRKKKEEKKGFGHWAFAPAPRSRVIKNPFYTRARAYIITHIVRVCTTTCTYTADTTCRFDTCLPDDCARPSARPYIIVVITCCKTRVYTYEYERTSSPLLEKQKTKKAWKIATKLCRSVGRTGRKSYDQCIVMILCAARDTKPLDDSHSETVYV